MRCIEQRWRKWAARTGALAIAVTSASALGAHPFKVSLRDAAGNPLTSTSTVPYSPEQTCGGFCHDVSLITQGYHFQQGRAAPSAAGYLVMRVSDDFNPAKSWLLSDGMYGKT